jgi:hypothetical protein
VLADHAAHRQADEMRVLDLQRIEQPDHIGGELVEAVGALRCRRSAVAARVVAQHRESRRQRHGERVPHRQVAGQRMRERDPGAAAFDL